MDYPNEKELETIAKWDIHDPRGLVEFLQSVWYFENYFHISRGRNRFFQNWIMRIRISTAGWSGNEDRIEALMQNMFWMIYWQKSVRGGHYTFEIPVKIWNK